MCHVGFVCSVQCHVAAGRCLCNVMRRPDVVIPGAIMSDLEEAEPEDESGNESGEAGDSPVPAETLLQLGTVHIVFEDDFCSDAGKDDDSEIGDADGSEGEG